jgi:hypothetical protein
MKLRRLLRRVGGRSGQGGRAAFLGLRFLLSIEGESRAVTIAIRALLITIGALTIAFGGWSR